MIKFIRDAVDGIKSKCDKCILHMFYFFPPSANKASTVKRTPYANVKFEVDANQLMIMIHSNSRHQP